MSHATEGELRRLYDDPLGVPDRTSNHVTTCRRCSARRVAIAQATERCARMLSGPQLVPDVDEAWARFGRRFSEAEAETDPQAVADDRTADRGGVHVSVPRRSLRLSKVSLRTGVAIAAAGAVLAGTAAAATLTTVFAPTRVAPVALNHSDLQEVADFMGLGDSHVLGGFPTPSGSRTFKFGTIEWSSSGPARQVASVGQATAATGFAVALPSRLPQGVGSPKGVMVQPQVRVTVSFNSDAKGVAGSSVVLHAGPAVLVEYGSASGINLPTLAVLTMPRPTGVSTAATMSQIEAFLLEQPGIPPELAEEVKLLGDLGTTLPIPVPSGASVRSVQVGGSPGVLVSDASNAVAGVIWEDGAGTVHVVAGLLDQGGVLNVADQIG